jgi:hypothetical protein
MKWRWCASALALGSGLLGSTRPALAAELELRVLLIATGDRDADPGRQAMEDLFEAVGVPYQTLDSSRQALTDDVLYESPTRGRFNGIILTDSETYLPGGGTGFQAADFARLHEYERTNGVREAILSGYPTYDPELGLDYGMGDDIDVDLNVEGAWQAPAGGTEFFEYVATDRHLPTADFTFLGHPTPTATSPTVEPLLVNANDPGATLISHLTYPDGREVLLSTLSNAWFYLHTSVLSYEFLSFATKGLFIGSRHAYLAVHNDDLFLPDEVWDPETLANFNEDDYNFRVSAGDIDAAAAAQGALQAAHPLASTLRVDLAFNGSGASLVGDPLTTAIVTHRDEFGFINHTYQAIQMDWLCPDEASAVGCVRTDYQSAYDDIEQNEQVWLNLGLPHADRAFAALLSDAHSGLSDRQGTADISDDIPFPEGLNPAFFQAASDLGVTTIASDSSRPQQGIIQRVPGFPQVLLPRYPTALFYNTTTPTELVSEYNYIFHDSYEARGQDPCTVPEALCDVRSYDQILAAEAETTLRHILSYQPYPHYFHQVNLRVYDDQGHTLQFDWLERVLAAYEQLIKLPLVNLRFYELGDLAWHKVLAQEAQPSGWLDTSTGQVTLSALGEADVDVTGVAGGETYGGQSLASIHLSPTATVVAIDAALDR